MLQPMQAMGELAAGWVLGELNGPAQQAPAYFRIPESRP